MLTLDCVDHVLADHFVFAELADKELPIFRPLLALPLFLTAHKFAFVIVALVPGEDPVAWG